MRLLVQITLLLLPTLLSATPVPWKAELYSHEGYAVRVREGGHGQAILLVHGLGVSSASMERLAQALIGSGFYVLLPDMPGQGNTEKSLGRSYSIDAQARFLRDLLRSRKIDRAIVIGNSMGGHIALSLALLYPETVQKLVLISPAGLQAKGPPPYEPLQIAKGLSPPVKRYLAWNNHVRNDIRNGMHYPVDGFLASVRCPTLIIWGENDRILPVELGSLWQQGIPGAQLVRLEGMGHMPQHENPALLLNRADAFLKSPPAADTVKARR